MEELENIARREWKDLSPLIIDAIEAYIKTHGEGNPVYELTKWQDQADFIVTPAFFETTEKWLQYLDKCKKKELESIEARSIFLREQSRTRWYKNAV